jgi:hypothetical protein
MNSETVNIDVDDEAVLNEDVADEALEAAANVTAMSYTYQTSAQRRCCR